MRKFAIVYLIIIVVFLIGFSGFKAIKNFNFNSQLVNISNSIGQELVRKPAVAGQFYPANKEDLEKQVNDFLALAQASQTKGQILGLIVPHAGYQFSGQVAAFGYKNLIGQEVDTVILMANSHTEMFDGISVFEKGSFETPLGQVKIDSDLAKALIKENKRIFYKESAHEKEHALEVQLPFLQKTLKSFKIVPIIFGNSQNQDYEILAKAILNNIKGKNVLLIASSDLSHYFTYQEAQKLDSETIDFILNNKTEQITNACGRDAVKTLMLVMQGLLANKIELLKSANSGDLPGGDKNRVVGYAAIGFFGERRGNLLNKEEQQELLNIARTSVEEYVKTGKTPDFKTADVLLNQNIGAFVTLTKDGQLRGCIGRFSPTDIPLYKVVSQMAIAAATQDKRFYPVSQEELSSLHYEVSVLSDMQKIDNWQDIEIGKQGVQIRHFTQSGVFLPQVALDNNWDLETFLEELCLQKVGLKEDCYKRDDIEIYVFTAQVFD